MPSPLVITEPCQTWIIRENGMMNIRVPQKMVGICFLEIAAKVMSAEIVIDVEGGSTLDCVALVSGEGASMATVQLRSTIQEDAVIRWHYISTACRSSDVTLTSTLRGVNAESTINAVFFASDRATHALKARNIFAAPRGHGEMTLRGIAEGQGRASIDGMIEITEQGTGTETYLTEDVLMLDPTAKIDAVPGLEIRTNDVKASHSATVSRVTAEDLFYFQSRGIDEATARQMYTDGFLHSLLDRIPDAAVRQTVADAILASRTSTV